LNIRFLKNSILPVLEGSKELEIVKTTRIPFNPAPTQRAGGKRKNKQETSHAAAAAAPAPVIVWVWQSVDKSKIPKPPVPKLPRQIFGTEVGVGEDWSHLSKRRQRTRVGKIRRDVATMRLLVAKRKEEGKQIYERNTEIHRRKTLELTGQAAGQTISKTNVLPRVGTKSPTFALS
jgi:hypothetical protein